MSNNTTTGLRFKVGDRVIIRSDYIGGRFDGCTGEVIETHSGYLPYGVRINNHGGDWRFREDEVDPAPTNEKVRFKVGDRVVINTNCPASNIHGTGGEIIDVTSGPYDYRVLLDDGEQDLLYDDEVDPEPKPFKNGDMVVVTGDTDEYLHLMEAGSVGQVVDIDTHSCYVTFKDGGCWWIGNADLEPYEKTHAEWQRDLLMQDGEDWGDLTYPVRDLDPAESLEQPEYYDEEYEEPDMVNHPPHYTSHASGVECIQVTEHYSFCVGNAIKYLWRAGLKGGSTEKQIEDLRKAAWYAEREAQRIEKLAATPPVEYNAYLGHIPS